MRRPFDEEWEFVTVLYLKAFQTAKYSYSSGIKENAVIRFIPVT